MSKFYEHITESVWGDIRKQGLGISAKVEDIVTYNNLTDEDCTIDMLYGYLIKNYELLGDEQISLNSGKYKGTDWYEVHIPITLDGENIETELDGDDCTKIWSIDFTLNLMKYVEKMNTVEEIDDENINSDTYARAYTGSSPLLCSSVVDFLDEILSLVPNPALKKKDISIKESVWGDIRKQGLGTSVKEEDDINNFDIDGLYDYIKSKYEKYVFYLDKDTFGILNKRNIVVDIISNVSLFTSYDKSGKLDHILLSWSKVKIGMPFFDKLSERFNVQSPNVCRRRITEKDGTCTNQTYIDVIDFFLENIDDMLVKESVWSDIRKRGLGKEIKKEDEIPQVLQKPLAIYIELFVTRAACRGDYTIGSYPDFRAFVYDFENNPRIEALDFDIKELLDYLEPNWDDVILPIILDTYEKYENDVNVAVDDIINGLKNINESVWGDIRKRGLGDSVKQEEFTEEFIDKVKSDLIGFTMSVVYYIENYELTFDGFYKYLEEIENPDEVKKIIYYVKTHKDECDKLLEKDIEFENKLLDEKVNVYLLRFVDNIVYDEKYHNTLSDIKKFASEIFKGHKSSYDFHINKRLVFKDKSVLFNEYIEDKWKDGSLKQKIDDLIKNENDEISKYGFVKEPGKTIADTVNDWWDSLDDSKRDELAWDEFGGDAEEEWLSNHHRDVDYDGEDFEADEWWDDAYGIRRVKIYCSEHSKTNESVWGDIRKRGLGDEIKKEDEITEDELKQIDQYISDYGNEVVLGWGRGSDACNLDEFIDYLKTDRKVNDRILKYVKDNWFGEICDGVNLSIEEKQEEWNQDMNESVWGDIRKQGLGVENKVEDDVLTDMEINSLNQFTLMYCREERAHYIQNHIVPPPPSGRKENDYDGLIKYIEDRRDENMFTNVGDYNKIIRFIKKNWDKLDMDKYIKKYIFSPDMMKGTKIVECEGVPGGLTPADVGGMGPAYFPGPNGEPGSGDLPSPTGIVYHQVAPFTMFLKDIKKKKKKKKFRIEDEPCAHSKNSKTYDYVDDFREYVDRTYNNIDRRK